MTIDLDKDYKVINKYSENKNVFSTKIVDEIPNDINEYNYIYENGRLIRQDKIDISKEKIKELENFIKDYRSQGIEWNNQLWSIDEECEKNLTAQITLLSFAPVEKVNWFSKSQVNELTINEFKELALVLSNAISNAKMKYYVYKNAIENATNEEELDAITFE